MHLDSKEIMYHLSLSLSVFPLQAVSVGKHVKGYHYIIANLVRTLNGTACRWLLFCNLLRRVLV